MSRAQLALNVDDLDEAITFYSKLFNTGPAKVKPGYANFAVAEPPLKLVLIENPGHGGTLNHLGVEVESSDAVHAEIARLTDEGLFTDEELGTTCCFATQDKVWVTGPAGEKWEVYTVLADSESFGADSRRAGGSAAPAGANRLSRPAQRESPPAVGEVVAARSIPAGVDRPRHGCGSATRAAHTRTQQRPESRSDRRHLTAHCARPAGHDVPGAGQGPL